MHQEAEVARKGLRSASIKSIEPTLQSLKLIAKALLYINWPDLAKQLESTKSPCKRAKLERKLAKLNDHILVTAPSREPTEAEGRFSLPFVGCAPPPNPTSQTGSAES